MAAPHVARLFVLCAGVMVFGGCANRGPGPMYLWETFPRQQYSTLLHEGASPEEQIRTLEAQAEKARGANAALPPGFRAHLGMLQLSVGDVEKARGSWEAEKAAFPESAPYMDRLLQKLNAPAKTATSNPT
jgi:hypothetical protein